MTAQELRQKYLDFFKSKNHAVIPSASLIPENDPTVLFTTAGMHPLVPYLMGQKHPEGKRLVNVQKCIRTTDIDEVGDTTHHTFFEMLGNWSLGAYFKKEAIEMSWEFLTSSKWLGLDKKRIAVSVFKGDNDAPLDQESIDVWKEMGLSEQRIAKLGKEDNWWGPAGQTGPCGPDTEMFYWVDDKNPSPDKFDPGDKRWVEIWNDVFMEYNKTKDGKYEPLEQKNVDTGMGLERVLTAINGFDDNYKTELFWPLIQKVEELSGKKKLFGKKYGESEEVTKNMRIIVDHIKAAVFMIADGVNPGKTGREYVLRRVIREAMHSMGSLSIEKGSLVNLVDIVIKQYGDVYENLKKDAKRIKEEIEKDDQRIEESIEKGLKAFRDMAKKKGEGEPITGKDAAYLYQTHSLSIENTKGLACEHGIKLSENFDKEVTEEMKRHQELSQTASAGKFKSGLADTSEETTKLHTAAHLLLASLRKVLGDHVVQKGSNITAERLRFDFSHPEKLTDEQKQEVEKLVNEVIKKDLEVHMEEMTLEEAKRQGAMGVFESKYGQKVRVYTVNDFSKEICAGPHVERTGQLGHFKIIKEQSSSAGVRRIKAVLR